MNSNQDRTILAVREKGTNRLFRSFACVLLMMGALSLLGCAGTLAYRESKSLFAEGKIEEGLAKLEEAVAEEPRNAEYRIALNNRRASYTNRLVGEGEAARREGKLTEAEKAYKNALRVDPNHVLAKQGLEAVVIERRHRQAVTEAEALFKQGGPVQMAEATEKLRPVLAENPNQKEALNLKARIDDANAKEQKPEIKLAAAFRKPITLEFRDAPLKSVFDVIAKISGLNFFFDKDLRPDLKASVLAKNTTVEDAVRLLLATNQLDQKILSEDSVLIYPNTPQKQQEYQTLTVRAFHLTNSDVKAVSNTIKTIVKTKDMVIDERLGLIIVRDTPEAIRMAERIVALQDLSDPEVMLEVEIMEIKRSRLMELGIQWPSQLALSPLQIGGAPLTLEDLRRTTQATTQVTIGSMLINARKEDQDGNILANPRIRVRNKDKAKVLIGDRVPVITTTSTSTGFVSESINYVDVGLKLEVEPHIYLDEEVAIKVNLEVSNLVREVLSKSGSLSYQIGTRNASTVLRLKNGETQILAGLISDEDRSSANKVPGLGELPVLGRLFGSQKDDAQRSEILLSITPRVVRSIRRPDLQVAEFESGTANSIGTPTLRLSTALPVKPKETGGAEAAQSATPQSASAPVPSASAVASTPSPMPTPAAPQTATTATALPASGNVGSAASPMPMAKPVVPIPATEVKPGAVPVPQAKATPTPAAVNATTPAAAPLPQSGATVTPIPTPHVQPAAQSPAAPSAASSGSVALAWQAPQQIKVGEQFTAVLRLTSQGPLKGMPLLVGYDPQALQVVTVQEGEFFKQGGGQSNFSHRVDPAQGKLFVAAVRQSAGGADPGINGTASVVAITFKAIKAGATALMQVLSASPEPQPTTPLAVPLEQAVKVLP